MLAGVATDGEADSTVSCSDIVVDLTEAGIDIRHAESHHNSAFLPRNHRPVEARAVPLVVGEGRGIIHRSKQLDSCCLDPGLIWLGALTL